jgi:hypothetical protein
MKKISRELDGIILGRIFFGEILCPEKLRGNLLGKDAICAGRDENIAETKIMPYFWSQ